MSDPIVINDIVVKNKVEKTKNPDNGLVTTTTYKGSKPKIEEKFNTLSAEADSTDNLKVGWGDTDVPSLIVTQTQNTADSGGGDDAGLLDKYFECDGNTVSNPIEHEEYWKNGDAIEIAAAIEAYRNNEDFESDDRYATQLYDDCLKKGIEYVSIFNVVLRYVQSCARNSNIEPAMENIHKVYKLDEIDSECGGYLPNTLKIELEKLDHEWLKQPPRLYQTAKTKYQITTEWWSSEKWAGAFYPGGTGKPIDLT